MASRENTCSTCAFWDEIASNVAIGYCHRNPPQIHGSYEDDDFETITETAFPKTASSEWCGEYKATLCPDCGFLPPHHGVDCTIGQGHEHG